jgi:predicted dehydrogenase
MHPLLYGMIGGGQDAFIGAVHRLALALDSQAHLIAGALSSTPERAIASGRALGLPHDRNYPTWQAMLEGESRRAPDDRIDFVVIVTPNDAHFAPAIAFAQAGFPIVLDKPMTRTLAEARELEAIVKRSGVPCAVTYNYTGYPLVQTAAQLVRDGALGTIRKVFIEYHQGWLATPLERQGHKQAAWRANPARAGAGAIADIGSHAENLCATMTGLEIESLCADAATLVPGRAVDDDASVLLRFHTGARGVLTCSQVCIGEENNLSIRIYGDKGTLRWRQENPNELWFCRLTEPWQLITRGTPAAGSVARTGTRLPPGHPEGFIEAFANVYRAFIARLRATRALPASGEVPSVFPGIDAGVRGVRFIERVIESASHAGSWVSF